MGKNEEAFFAQNGVSWFPPPPPPPPPQKKISDSLDAIKIES